MSIVSKFFPMKSSFGSCGRNSKIQWPAYVAVPSNVHLEENVIVRGNVSIQNHINEHLYIKRYTVISRDVTIVTNNHKSTVGIPQCLLGASHINDTSRDITIEEDVWVGTKAIVLAGGNLGRGCIVGACSVVTKPVPPYALVIGSPAKIVGVKFTIDQIIEHEKALYPENERFSREYLEELFAKYYDGKKVFGVQTELTSEDLAALERAKKVRRYIEPKL